MTNDKHSREEKSGTERKEGGYDEKDTGRQAGDDGNRDRKQKSIERDADETVRRDA